MAASSARSICLRAASSAASASSRWSLLRPSRPRFQTSYSAGWQVDEAVDAALVGHDLARVREARAPEDDARAGDALVRDVVVDRAQDRRPPANDRGELRRIDERGRRRVVPAWLRRWGRGHEPSPHQVSTGTSLGVRCCPRREDIGLCQS